MTPELIKTCPSHPEQYELRVDGEMIAYFRLRWGRFTVECPGPLDDLVFVHTWANDPYKGEFDSGEEAELFMGRGMAAIVMHYARLLV